MAGYILDQTWEREADRLGALEQCCDPLTVESLARTGVGSGWHCLEVGAGRGSIARWLAAHVGIRGAVLAVDLDTTLLEPHRGPRLEVRRLDVLSDPLPDGTFDLVHARHVLGHLPDQVGALRRLAAALRPGGWMVIEDFDFGWVELGDWPCDPPELGPLVARVWAGALEAMRAGSYDGGWARRLPSAVRAAGLEGVAGEVRALVDDRSFAECMRLTVLRLREQIVALGVAAGDLDSCAELLADSRTCLIGAPLVSVRGRRPPD
ncbi:MAG TPA: methyltransferase domain-containing protein [Candidatus Dormibacteraeota bacterium]